jgi:hypothetical protein
VGELEDALREHERRNAVRHLEHLPFQVALPLEEVEDERSRAALEEFVRLNSFWPVPYQLVQAHGGYLITWQKWLDAYRDMRVQTFDEWEKTASGVPEQSRFRGHRARLDSYSKYVAEAQVRHADWAVKIAQLTSQAESGDGYFTTERIVTSEDNGFEIGLHVVRIGSRVFVSDHGYGISGIGWLGSGRYANARFLFNTVRPLLVQALIDPQKWLNSGAI